MAYRSQRSRALFPAIDKAKIYLILYMLALRPHVFGLPATHQNSHTRGFVDDGKVGGEGLTNWTAFGEATLVIKGKPGGIG